MVLFELDAKTQNFVPNSMTLSNFLLKIKDLTILLTKKSSEK